MLAKKCDVTLYKGMQTKIAKNIYEHEVKLLEAIYGDGTVEVYKRRELVMPEGKKYQVEGDVISYEVEELDYHEEYDRLSSCYGMHPEIKVTWVEYVFGNRNEEKLNKECNEKYKAEFGKGSYAPPTTEKEKIEADEDGLKDFTSAELKALLKTNKINFPSMANKSILLNTARKAGLNGITVTEDAGGIKTGVA